MWQLDLKAQHEAAKICASQRRGIVSGNSMHNAEPYQRLTVNILVERPKSGLSGPLTRFLYIFSIKQISIVHYSSSYRIA